jgi:hypothetical protein
MIILLRERYKMFIIGNKYGANTVIALTEQSLEDMGSDGGILARMQLEIDAKGAMTISKLADDLGITVVRVTQLIKGNPRLFRRLK